MLVTLKTSVKAFLPKFNLLCWPTTPNGNLEQHRAALADSNETDEHFADSLTLPTNLLFFLLSHIFTALFSLSILLTYF